MRNNTIIWIAVFVSLLFANFLSAQEDTSKVELVFQKGHSRPIIVMNQSYDGKTLATGGTDLIIRFRDLRTGIEFNTYTSPRWSIGGENTYISWVKFSADDKYLMCQVNSDLFVHILVIRLSDHKVVADSYQNGTYGQVKGAFFADKGASAVICYAELKGKNGYMRRCNLATGVSKTVSYYTYVPDGVDKEASKEHEGSFVHGNFFTRNQKYLLTIGDDLRREKKGRQVVFVMDMAKLKVIKRIVLPEIKGGLSYLVVPDGDNEHFYVIPKLAGTGDDVYWKKYNILTGEMVEEIPYTFDEKDTGFRYVRLGLTTDDYFFYIKTHEDDSIRFIKPGELKMSKILYTKTAKGNTHIDRIQHLGVISTICKSHDAKSIFVAFCGTNEDKRKHSNYQYDEVSDVITIRQIDIKTGRVLREYASLGKEINKVFFHPKGKSLWITENYSSHAKNLKKETNLSVLNIWKFRDIGNLYYEPIYREEINEVFLSTNKKEAVFQTNDFDDVRLFNTAELNLSKVYFDKRLKKEEGLKLKGLREKKPPYPYRLIDFRVNPSFTKLVDSKYHVYDMVDNSLENKSKYIGQLDLSAIKKQRIEWSAFMNKGTTNYLGMLSRGSYSSDKVVSNKLHFYNLDSCGLEASLDFKAVFKKPFVAALNSDRTWLAFSPSIEYFQRDKEGIQSPVLYFVDLEKRAIKKRVVLSVCRDGTRYDPNTQKTTKVTAMCAQYPIYSLTFTPKSTHVLGGMFDNSIRFWEIETGNIVGEIKGHESPVTSISVHPKKKIMVSGDLSGQLIFWHTHRWNILAKMVIVGQEDYIIYTPDGYYMATSNALDWVAFKKGDQLFRFDQFDIQYNRPDIVMDSLGLTSSLMIRMLKKAYEKRLNKLGLEEGDFGKLHAPTLSIDQEIPFETQEKFLSFNVTAEDKLYPLKKLNVYVNQVPIYGLSGKLISENVQKVTEEVSLKLSKGINNILVTTTNTKGVESLKERILVEYNVNEVTPSKPNLHLLMIGVSEYEDASRNLTFAAKDANDLMEIFSKQEEHYSAVKKHLLTNDQATAKNIIKLLEDLKTTKVDDEVIIYFSCHGVLDEDLNYYLATHETDFEAPQNTSLNYNTLENILAQIPSRKKLMFIDACHSGEIDKEEEIEHQEDVVVNTVNTVTMRSKSGNSILKPVVGLKNSFTYMQVLFTNVGKGTGATIISAAGGMEFALESDDWSNSVFAFSILKGIREQKADLDNNGFIKISELQKYVKSKVYELTNGRQVPTTRQVNRYADFDIYRE